MSKYFFLKTFEYQYWLDGESAKSHVQIEKRLSNIELDGHFGDHKYLKNHIWELRWANGRRIYYAHIPEKKVLLLLGGNKNGQSQDIVQAKKIIKKYTYLED
jgi:putative addiction module killer protein